MATHVKRTVSSTKTVTSDGGAIIIVGGPVREGRGEGKSDRREQERFRRKRVREKEQEGRFAGRKREGKTGQRRRSLSQLFTYPEVPQSAQKRRSHTQHCSQHYTCSYRNSLSAHYTVLEWTVGTMSHRSPPLVGI